MPSVKTYGTYALDNFTYDVSSGIYYLKEDQRTFRYSDGTIAENQIYTILKDANDLRDNSEELERKIYDWPTRYHFGRGRSNILKALDLPRSLNVLELGAGCGTITRYLGENFHSVVSVEGSYIRSKIAHERCRNLPNVKIYNSNFMDISFAPIYDIVVLVGVLEYSPRFVDALTPEESFLSALKHVKTALKPDGVIILAIENKVGLKYWSGYPEDHTGKIFNNIEGYPNLPGIITFSKKELDNNLKLAGLSKLQYYYCFPDYKFATSILSDVSDGEDYYLHNWVSAPFSGDMHKRYLFNEGLAVKTLSQAGLIRDFANSFLIVAGTESSSNNAPSWIAKHFSTGLRKSSNRCVTTLYLKPELYVEKIMEERHVNKNEYRDGSLLITHEPILKSKWIAGDLLSYRAIEILYQQDYFEKSVSLAKSYYYELIRKFGTSRKDDFGIPILSDYAFDFIYTNIICSNNVLHQIDCEFKAEVPADYVLYRNLTFYKDQSHVPVLRFKDLDLFIFNIMKSIIPSYTKARHKYNKALESRIQGMLTVKPSEEVILFHTLHDKLKIPLALRGLWFSLPTILKKKIQDQLEVYRK